MSLLYAFGFEGGYAPTGVSITTGSIHPGISRAEYWKFALQASLTSEQQASVSINLGAAKSKLGGSLYTRALILTSSFPYTLVTFGTVTISITSATNIRVHHGSTDTDFTIPALDTTWHSLHFNIDLSATTNAITIYWDSELLGTITRGTSVGTTDTTCAISGLKGTGSTIDDIAIDDAYANGGCPATIACHKASYIKLAFSQWEPIGSPTNVSTNIDILGMEYCSYNGLFYALETSGKIYSINPNTLAATLVTTVNSSYGHCAMVYHAKLNRLYFVGNTNKLAYLDPTTGSVTEATQTVYYANDTYASGAYYNQVTEKAYIVTEAASGNTNSINIHIIDSSGSYSVVSSTGTNAPVAPVTRHIPVVFDTVNSTLLFPCFSSFNMGILSSSDTFSLSSTDSVSVTDVIETGGAYTTAGNSFLAASAKSSGSKLRTYSAGSFTDYHATQTVTNTGITSSGMCYHPTMGLLFFKDSASGNLHQVMRRSSTNALRVSSAVPSTAILTGKVNPITGGMFYLANSSLCECRLLSQDSSVNLLVKDSSFVYEATLNESLIPLVGIPYDLNTRPIAGNVMNAGCAGQGILSLNGSNQLVSKSSNVLSKLITRTSQYSVEPDILYEMHNLATLEAPVNKGIEPSTFSLYNTPPIAAEVIMTNSDLPTCYQGSSFIRVYGNSTGNGGHSISNTITSLTGDFTFILIVAGAYTAGFTYYLVKFNSNFYIRSSITMDGGYDVYWNGSLAATIPVPKFPAWGIVKIYRTGTTCGISVNGVVLWSTTYGSTITLDGTTILGTNQVWGSTSYDTFAAWKSTYIADENIVPSRSVITPVFKKA